MKIGRNEPCSCGSGRKYKKCCGSPDLNGQRSETNSGSSNPNPSPRAFTERLRARELQRIKQQGLGRPIVALQRGSGSKTVFIGDGETMESKAGVFQDFLVDYLGKTLGRQWIINETQKPFDDRHTIMQWFDIFNRQRKLGKRVGDFYQFAPTGASLAFVGLAYSLYLMRHNTEIHALLVIRLKDRLQFQGAYYEVSVANILIRAGFELTLEDETDKLTKHCEFAAVSKETGQIYSVECKSRSVQGMLHKEAANVSKRQGPLSQLTNHLKLALKKPSKGERLVFIDINSPDTRAMPPVWVEPAAAILEQYETASQSDKRAFVFVTNICFHWHLEEQNPPMTGFAHGFNIPDFAKPGMITFSQAWRNKRKHRDCYRIADVIQKFGNIPTTFDGSLPSSKILGEREPLQIGERYFFSDIDGGIGAEVESAVVMESEKSVRAIVKTDDGRRLILSEPMSEFQFADYQNFPETYFGEVNRNGRGNLNEYELFEWFVGIYLDHPRESVLLQIKDSPQYELYEQLNDEDLVLAVCEGFIQSQRMMKPSA